MNKASPEILAKVKHLYEIINDKTIDEDDYTNISQILPRLYIADSTYYASVFTLKRHHFKIIVLADCSKCITEGHYSCKPDVKRLLLPYQYSNKPVYVGNKDLDIMGIIAIDDENFPISNYFRITADAIEESLSLSLSTFKNNVLVISKHGKSRAVTIVVAYLMIKQGMPLEEALKTVGQKRSVKPNFGFMMQLLKLGSKLKLSGKTVVARPAFRCQKNPFPLRNHPMSDIMVYSKVEEEKCCVLHSYKNIPPCFVYKIVDDKERDESLFTVSAFDRQNF